MIKDLPVNVQHFFNTINLEDQELKAAIAQCKKQEDHVLWFFKKFPDAAFTPFQVLWFLVHIGSLNVKTPITSIRRTITNLTEAGLLVKTENKVIEEQGKANHLWKLFKPELKQIQGKLNF